MTGLLLCVGTPLGSLADIAKQGAAALELANDYTDYIEAARRRKPTTPAAEVQQHLFPPRIARIAGAQLAGTLLPTYEVGGDWFDFVENRDAALGALRAARRSGQDFEEALASVHETVRRLGNQAFYITALVARCRAATATLTWVNCGHPPAYVSTPTETCTNSKAPSIRRSAPKTPSPLTRRPAGNCTPGSG